MKIYTKTGDDGSTGLFGGARVDKHDPLVEAYGSVDETNAGLGLALATGCSGRSSEVLLEIQSDLFSLGAEIACLPSHRERLQMPFIGADEVARLERAIDEFEAGLTPLKNFVLPGGTLAAAALHQARTVCRRAERRVAGVESSAALRPELLIYLNRLGDLLFVMARFENEMGDTDEPLWQPRRPQA